MTTRRVTVTKYVSCNGVEFNDERGCENYESNLKVTLQRDVFNCLERIRDLKEKANECRIKARLIRLDAERLKRNAVTAMEKSRYCLLMSDHFNSVSEYNQNRRELSKVRRSLNEIINNQYMWFGKKSRKSSVARLERKRRSDMWRREHTPDQWRTPNKIRVNKLPKEEQ